MNLGCNGIRKSLCVMKIRITPERIKFLQRIERKRMKLKCDNCKRIWLAPAGKLGIERCEYCGESAAGQDLRGFVDEGVLVISDEG